LTPLDRPLVSTTAPTVAARMSFRVALVLWSAGAAAALRFYAMPGHDAIDVWLGFALVATTWGWLWAIDHAATRLAPLAVRVFVSSALGVVFYLSLCAELAYTYFYSVAEDRELSLLSIGVWDGLKMLFAQLLPVRGVLLLGSLVAFAHVAAAFWARRGPAIVWPSARAASGALARRAHDRHNRHWRQD
jgi:hypothetical protein